MAAKKLHQESKSFIFRKHVNIGSADASDDTKYLTQCFIDNGELDILLDINDPRSIITGRTGSGKTALIKQIENTQEKVITIAPENLALTFISNNGILNFFINAGVNMDLFYRLLWRHVFAVEIIKEHYHIINEKARDSFITQIVDRLKGNKPRSEAISYILKWGDKFWMDYEYRVKEVTQTLEQNLGATIDSSLSGIVPGLSSAKVAANAEMAKNLTEVQKGEVVRRGQRVVDSIQMKTLSDIMEMLENDILDDDQKKYIITIDRLDENWINDEIRYHLIRALLDTVHEFNSKITNVKIIVAVREDLLDRVFRYTRSPGYQEEKYISMYLPITWNVNDLETLVDRRVYQLVVEQYTNHTVQLKDILPKSINKENPIQYMMSRTMFRPRDIIMFFNECIKLAEGKPKLTQSIISQAESIYSENRLRALADEWSTDYPNLIEITLFLKKFPSQFNYCNHLNIIENKMLEFLINEHKTDFISELIRDKFDSGDINGFTQEMLKILYRAGVIGVKQESYSTIIWSFQGQKLTNNEINPRASYHIHPAFWRVLGVTPPYPSN